MLEKIDVRKYDKILKWHIVLVIVLMIFISMQMIVRVHKITDDNYQNSNATYHVLLIMEAYDQTPVSVHKFLPIVSLGGQTDKFISWGATIPDDKGNYYYTSFSPAGYIAPYFFVKATSVTSSLSRVTVTTRKTANLGENIRSVTNSFTNT